MLCCRDRAGFTVKSSSALPASNRALSVRPAWVLAVILCVNLNTVHMHAC